MRTEINTLKLIFYLNDSKHVQARIFGISLQSAVFNNEYYEIKTFQRRLYKIWTSLIHLDAFFPLTLIFALFPWTNVMQLSKQSLVRWRRFHGYHCPDRNTHLKNGGSFKKYSKFTPIIHINPNSYSFRITFVMIIIVRFFCHLLHQLIKIWKSGHKLRQGHKLVRLPYYMFLFSLYNFTFCTGIFELFVGDFPGKWQYLR